jgi:hypothetical protein
MSEHERQRPTWAQGLNEVVWPSIKDRLKSQLDGWKRRWRQDEERQQQDEERERKQEEQAKAEASLQAMEVDDL